MNFAEVERQGRLARARLTSPALIGFEYFAPPSDLADYVATFFLLRCDEPGIADIQPAGMGVLVAFLRGRGEIYLPEGRVDSSHALNLLTPLSAAAPVLVEGPWHAFGATLTPLGWAALTGRSAAEFGDRLFGAGEVLGEDFSRLGNELVRRYGRPGFGPEHMIQLIAAAIRPVLKPVPPQHMRLIATVAEWMGETLSPRVEDLASRALYSPRQLQRLVDRYFGMPPKQLARKYRAIRAAALFSDPGLSVEQVARIENAFYDQSHMIREIRLFIGRTPARLGDNDRSLQSALLDLRHYREIPARIAPLPDDFG